MKQQLGGTLLGFVLGALVGLGAALAVAVYVTKVPIPFVNRALSHSPDQDATEQQKNKNWDPNAPLYGKNPAKPAVPAEPVEPPEPAPPVASEVPAVPVPRASTPRPSVSRSVSAAASAARPELKPAVPASAAGNARPELKPAVTADPLGDLVKARAVAARPSPPATDADAEHFSYFVQVGAFRTAEDAESQRAKLSLAGIQTKVSEREQAGRMVYRVRVGPFDTREEADKSKLRLDATGIETALVRVQR